MLACTWNQLTLITEPFVCRKFILCSEIICKHNSTLNLPFEPIFTYCYIHFMYVILTTSIKQSINLIKKTRV